MFVEAFGLRRDPFMDTADPAFYYETLSCANARRRLADCLATGRGLAVIVGPIGAGKTTLCNAVSADVIERPHIRAGLILDPSFATEEEFVRCIAASLDVDCRAAATVREVKECLKRALFESVESGAQYVLFIDEAQLLPEPLFETLRALLNYQIDERKLLAVALAGQMELAPKLARHPGLSDRVSMWIEIGPLAESEAAALLDHRLRVAGFTGDRSPFSAAAASAAWRLSGGLPRRLTALAREAMEVSAERRSRVVDVDDVRDGVHRIPPPSAIALAGSAAVESRPATRRRWPWTWLSP